MSCYCDAEPFDIYRANLVKSRKDYKCDECGCEIKKGEKYEYASGFYADNQYWSTWRTCADCVEIRAALSEMECFCWGHGGLFEAVQEQFQEADFCPGLRFAYLRIAAKHRWRRVHK